MNTPTTDEKRDSQGLHWSAVNWAGDVRSLTFDELMEREKAVALYVCAMLRPPTVVRRRAAADPREAERALDLWEVARDEMLSR